MKNLKRLTGFILMCMMVVTMAGAAWASVSGTDRAVTENTETENVNNVSDSENAGDNAVAGGEISSFNNYGENGKYEALGEYEVAYGAELSEVTNKLPATLTAKLTTGEEVEVPVTWVCISDNVGGTSYVPNHTDATVAYTFEAKLAEGYTLANNMPEDYVMPFATVRYTEDAQELNSSVESDVDAVMDEARSGMSAWSWIIWIVIIVIIVVVIWWIFAGNKGNGKDNGVS